MKVSKDMRLSVGELAKAKIAEESKGYCAVLKGIKGKRLPEDRAARLNKVDVCMFACFKNCMQVKKPIAGSGTRGWKLHPCRLPRDVPHTTRERDGTAQGLAPAVTFSRLDP